ncbi:MAG: TlpA family protein disulfide reductase [Bradymonadia bacterium]
MHRLLIPLTLCISGAVAANPPATTTQNPADLAAPAFPGAIGSVGVDLKGTKLGDAGPIKGPEGHWSLSKMRGKAVLVNFWASWCAPCVKELPVLAELYRRHHREGFEVVAISLDAQASEAMLVKQRLKLPFLIVGDPKGTEAAKMAVSSLPASMLFDQQGRLVWRTYDEIPPDDPELEAALAKTLQWTPGGCP